MFDTFAEKTSQGVLHGAEQQGWNVEVIQTDVRVGGTSIVRMGPAGREPDTETRMYSVVDRHIAWNSGTRWRSPRRACRSTPR